MQEMEKKLNGVLSRHKDKNPTNLMHDSRLGFGNRDKQAVNDHANSGGEAHEVSVFVSINF